MSGAMRRIGEYLGLLEDTGRYDDEYADGTTRYDDTYEGHYAARGPARWRPSGPPSRGPRGPPGRDRRAPRRPPPRWGADHDRRPRVAELSRITTLHPRTYNEARTVGENFRDGTPVIMNLSEMDDNDAKRLVDFAAGLVFATRGTIERVTSKVFLLSPPNVSVAAEDKERIAERRLLQPELTGPADRRRSHARDRGDAGLAPGAGMIVRVHAVWSLHPHRAVGLHRASVDPLRRRLGAGLRAVLVADGVPPGRCSRSSTRPPTRRSRRCAG